MSKNDNERKYYIYSYQEKRLIEVDKQVYDAVYKEPQRIRKQQQRRGLCSCPRSKWYFCDGCCAGCTYEISPVVDGYFVIDKESRETQSILETLADDSVDVEQQVVERLEIERIKAYVDSKFPGWFEVFELINQGFTERELAARFGKAKTTFHDQLVKIRKDLKEKFYEEF